MVLKSDECKLIIELKKGLMYLIQHLELDTIYSAPQKKL